MGSMAQCLSPFQRILTKFVSLNPKLMKFILRVSTVVVFSLMFFPLQSQHSSAAFYPYPQSFNLDSLKGFDENAAARSALSEQFTGPEFKVRMYQLKRQYINNKYNLHPSPVPSIFQSPSNLKSASASCVNEDFEASAVGPITGTTQVVSGWTLVAGSHTSNATYNTCNLLGCCPNYVYESAILSSTSNAGYVDPVIGPIYPIYSVFGTVAAPPNAIPSNSQIPGGMFGNNFIRLNSSMNNYSIEKLSKTFQVTPSNALFRFAFINVISCGHACCDASSFKVTLTNVTTNSVISNSSYSVSGLSAACNNTSWVTYYNPGSFTPATVNSAYIFNPWQFNFINLLSYMWQTVTIDVIAADCTAGGHYSYTYFDAQCSPIEIDVNGTPRNTLSCVNNATVSGPSSMPNYHWIGPGSFSSTAQSFTTNVPGNYSLTLNQDAPLPPASLVLNLNIQAPVLQVSSSSSVICEGASVNLSASGASTYTWSTGSNNANITLSPGSTTTYTLSGTNAYGCEGSTVFTQVVSPCVGINNNGSQNKTASLFPNPNKGSFVLNIYEPINKPELTVVDVLGKVVFKQAVQTGENSIKIPGLVSGLYYYTISSNNVSLANGRFTVE